MTEVLCAIVSILLLCAAVVVRPTHARCPAGWYVGGIRPIGEFDCARVPGGNPDDDNTWGRRDGAIDRPGRLTSRLYCTGGSRPVVVDDRTVGCTR